MRRITCRLILLCMAFSLLVAGNAYAWGRKPLVTINDLEYTTEDYKHWWKYWNNGKDAPLPEDPEGFVDFHILAHQGLEMEYDDTPEFQHKVEVFLKVRAMMRLKYDEVDSKAEVTDEDVKKYYTENHTPLWSLQILTYSDFDKAQKVYEKVLPFKGLAAGKLVFADMQGVSSEDGGPLNYEEAKISPAALKPDGFQGWLERLKKAKEMDILEPFAKADDPDTVILLRIGAIEMPPEHAFTESKGKLKYNLNKEKRSSLTNALINKLIKKYNVSIDQELLQEIDIKKEYSSQYLDRKVATGEGVDVSVGLLLHNCRKSASTRSSLTDEELKKFVLNSIVSQLLVDTEALDRGYEKEPPLKWGYEFYRQNRLKAAIENELRAKITVSDDEIKKYYNSNKSEFSSPENVVYEIIEGEKKLIKKMWTGVLTGAKFSAVAEKYSKSIEMNNVDMNSVPDELKAAVKKLVEDEVSLPVATGNGYALVKLLKRVPARSYPFEKVREKVVEKIKKNKFAEERAAYLQELRSLSTINVNNDVWRKLVRESKNEKE